MCIGHGDEWSYHMNIQEAANEFYQYSKYFRGYTKQTIRRYRHAINYYFHISQISSFEEVSLQNIRAFFYYGRTERGWKNSSFITHHKSLVIFFRWCKAQGYIKEDFLDLIELPKLEYRLPSKLTKQEAFRLLEIIYNYPYQKQFMRHRNHAIFSTFIFAGIRKSELMNLKYTDVDMENRVIRIVQGKGSKDRVIPMCQTLATSLHRYLEERRKAHKTCPEFFTSLPRNQGITETSMKRITEKLRKDSGIVFTAHKLRHTFATLMLEGGCDIYSLSKMMGHNDLKTTTIYLSASAEHLRGQIDKHPLDNGSIDNFSV